MTKSVKIIEVRFTEDEIFDGCIPPECYENAREDVTECEDVEDAVRIIQRAGCTFAATANDWAADPDGSYIENYATAGRVETSAHLEGAWSELEREQIISQVG